MKRIGFKMKLKPGYETEYKRRHDEIWPELKSFLTEAGIRDYSIYLDEETHILFASHKVTDDFDPDRIPNHPVVKKWWAYMADIMETNEDNSPITVPLIDVFYMK